MKSKIIILLKRRLIRGIDDRLTRNFRMIFFGRTVLNSANQLMGLFLPIFLYQVLGMNLIFVICFYLIVDVLYANLVVFSCRHIMNKIGIKKSLQISVLFGSGYYAILFVLDRLLLSDLSFMGVGVIWLLVPAIFFSLMFRMTHWIPFHTHIAKLTDKHIRGSQLSLMEATMMVLGAIMPIIAGLILSYMGFAWLFLLALSIFLLSILPFSLLPKIKEEFSWSYKRTWKEIFSKKFRPNVLAYIGDGAESIIGIVIWPIFIWQLLDGNYLQVGIISSIIIIATISLQIIVGGFLDKSINKGSWLRYGSLFYAMGWVLKAFVGGALQIFVFSTYHNISRIFSRTSFDTLNYDIAADQGHYVDEYTVIREVSVMIGKILMGLIIIIVIPFFPLQYVFLLAALASLTMGFLVLAKKN